VNASSAWRSIEAVHDVVYFAPGAKNAFDEAGVHGWWNGYFASRSAALGTPGPALVTALFHGFAPAMVAKSVPAVWEHADPADVLHARVDLALECLSPLVPESFDADGLASALEGVVARLDLAGRPLAAAHAEVPAHEEALGRVWQHVTTLREFRGDAHIAVLSAKRIDGAAANVLAEACDRTDGRQQVVRGWSDEQWSAAQQRLRDRGWLKKDGTASKEGRKARRRIEKLTDEVVAAGVLDPDAFEEAAAVLAPLAAAVRDSGAVPYPNPVGAGAPD
jgi:hypothetical protein